jgi:hypothetical protein
MWLADLVIWVAGQHRGAAIYAVVEAPASEPGLGQPDGVQLSSYHAGFKGSMLYDHNPSILQR